MPRGVDDHLVEAGGRGGAEEVRLASPGRGAKRVAAPGHPTRLVGAGAASPRLGEGRVEVGDRPDPPARRIGLPAGGPIRPGFRWGAVLAALAERAVLLRLAVVAGGGAPEVEGAIRAGRGENRPQTGE